jgi:hypothetical protein
VYRGEGKGGEDGERGVEDKEEVYEGRSATRNPEHVDGSKTSPLVQRMSAGKAGCTPSCCCCC